MPYRDQDKSRQPARGRSRRYRQGHLELVRPQQGATGAKENLCNALNAVNPCLGVWTSPVLKSSVVHSVTAYLKMAPLFVTA